MVEIVLLASVNCWTMLIDWSFVAQSHKTEGIKNIGEYIKITFIPLKKQTLIRIPTIWFAF